jgi:hypothetical protein
MMAAMEARLFRGLYRTPAWAYVTNEIMSFHVPEAEYRVFGYEPDYDGLPWQESYIAAKQSEEAGASGGSVR